MNTSVHPSRLRRKIVARGLIGLGAIGGLLFGGAGRVNWPAAWLLISSVALYITVGGWWFYRRDPELLEERMTTAPNVPSWDRLLVRIYWILLPAFFVTAALDAGRFRWSTVSAGVQVIGAAAIVAALIVIWWCTATNHFLSANVRLQRERGHRLVQDGPYRLVRHPMYTSIIAFMIGMALMLGSWLAVLPAALIALLLVVRASLEDRLLQTELAGYLEYASRVPARLIPGVW